MAQHPLAALFKEELAPLVKSMQERRRPIEEREWLANLDCWKGRHRGQGFKGEWFNHFLPAGRRSAERFVTRAKQMLFPSPEFFEVYPIVDTAHEIGAIAEAWRSTLLWLTTGAGAPNNVIATVDQLLRCFVLYQRAIVKCSPQITPSFPVPQVWPVVRAVDPFALYVWPETVSTPEEAEVIVEHTFIPWTRYESMQRAGVVGERMGGENITRGELVEPEWPTYYIQRLSQSGLAVPSQAEAGKTGASPVAFVAVTEVWVLRDFRWIQGWLAWNVNDAPKVVRVNTRYPFQPYHMVAGRQLPGEHYSTSMMSDLAPLNTILNDQFNMMLEGMAVSILPPTAVDMNLVQRAEALVYKPRAKWPVPPEAVKAIDSKANISAAMQGIQASMGFMDSFSGSNPLAEGQPTRGMPRAGFAVSNLIGLSMSDIRYVAEIIEQGILTPMLGSLARLLILFTPPDQLVRVPGSERLTQPIFPAQYLRSGEYAFRWVGTLQAQDMQVRAQRLMSMLGTLAKVYPSMQQQGAELDFVSLVKHMWRYALGERGADTIVFRRDPATGPPAPPAQPQPGGGGGQAPVPASPEQSERQMSRQMTETAMGQSMNGLGQG